MTMTHDGGHYHSRRGPESFQTHEQAMLTTTTTTVMTGEHPITNTLVLSSVDVTNAASTTATVIDYGNDGRPPIPMQRQVGTPSLGLPQSPTDDTNHHHSQQPRENE